MNKLPKASHPYPRLGLSRGDLQWIEVKRPLPKHRKEMVQGCPPSSPRDAGPPTIELVLSIPWREPRSNPAFSEFPTSFSGRALLQRRHYRLLSTSGRMLVIRHSSRTHERLQGTLPLYCDARRRRRARSYVCAIGWSFHNILAATRRQHKYCSCLLQGRHPCAVLREIF